MTIRLQAARHDDAVRRPQRARRHRHRPEHAAPPASGVHPLPQRHRTPRCRPTRPSTSSSTTMPPTSIRRCAPGSTAIHASPSTSRRPPAPGSTPSRASSPSSTKRRLKRGVFDSRRRPPGRHQPLRRRAQSSTQALHLDRRPRQNHRRRQTRAPSVRFHPLASIDRASHSIISSATARNEEGTSSPSAFAVLRLMTS